MKTHRKSWRLSALLLLLLLLSSCSTPFIKYDLGYPYQMWVGSVDVVDRECTRRGAKLNKTMAGCYDYRGTTFIISGTETSIDPCITAHELWHFFHPGQGEPPTRCPKVP